MKESFLKLLSKRPLNDSSSLWELRLYAPEIEAKPGQFVNIAVGGKYLRRPISISDYSESILTLIIQIVGEGTKIITETPLQSSLNILTGLGNGFTLSEDLINRDTLILGGGVGYAPLVGLLKTMKAKGYRQPLTVFGFRDASEVPLVHFDELKKEGLDIEICTDAGDFGYKGNALETAKMLIAERTLNPVYFYTCGPMPMLKAACNEFNFDGQLSLEARMGCGFGACMGCSIQTSNGPKRICKEGPVLTKKELWS